MLKVILHHIRTFYCITGFTFWARLIGYSVLIGFILSVIECVVGFSFNGFTGRWVLDVFGWFVLLILSRYVISFLSRFTFFNNWFFGEDFDYQAAADGFTDTGKTVNMVEQYRGNNQFSIYVGTSNDYLYRIGAGPRLGNIHVALNLADSCTNFMITGGIGSGKTVSAISPILLQLLDPANSNNEQTPAGLIFDIKGDFKGCVYDLASRFGRTDITTIGAATGQAKMNIIGGLSPDIAAAFLKSGFEQTGGSSSDSFWIDSSTDAMKAGLTILQKVDMYTLNYLYQLIFDKKIEETVLSAAAQLASGDLELTAALDYYTGVYLKNEDRTLQSIKATIGTLLSTFTSPQIVDTFCNTKAADANTLFTDIIEKGRILLLDFPLSVNGYGAKTIYVLMKLRFMNLVQTRPTNPKMNQDRPVYFICDEYQNCITKSGFVSDSNFWDKSRSAKCIGLISFQTVSSIVSALNGDRATTETILANFRQKIFFANEDPSTIDYIQKIAGKYEQVRTTTTEGHSKQSDSFFKKTNNTGTSTTTVQSQIVGAEDIRALQQGAALGILRVNNNSFIDVLSMQYTPTDANHPAPVIPQL